MGVNINLQDIERSLAEAGVATEGSQELNDIAAAVYGNAVYGSYERPRNLQDQYQNMNTGDVYDDLESSRSGLVSVFINILRDINVGAGVRNANWFNQHHVLITGRRSWDRRGAVGTQNYTDVLRDEDTLGAIQNLKDEGFRIVGAEICDGAVPLTTYEWAEKSAVVYGEEGGGLTQDVLDLVDDVVYIPGRGSVRSLNVAVTSGIFGYDYSMKTGLI